MRNDLIQNYCYLIKTSLLRNLLEDPKAQRFYKFKEELVPLLLKRQFALNTSVNVFIVPEGFYSKRVYNLRLYMEANMECCFPLTGKDKSGQNLKPLPFVLLSTSNSPRNILNNFYRAGGVQVPAEYKLVSSDCVIQDDIKIGEKTTINKSIIGNNARNGNKCKIIGSIIMDNVVIEDEVNINNSIVCSQVSIGSKCKVLNSQMAYGSTVQPSTTLKEDIWLSIN